MFRIFEKISKQIYMFGDFENSYNLKQEEENVNENSHKYFELQPYSEYMNQKEPEKKNKKKLDRPVEFKDKNNYLKIIPFKTNKNKIKKRKLMEKKIIPSHPFRLLLVGASGSGKTQNLLNLMTRPQFYGKTDPKDKKSQYFDLVFLFSPTADGGDDLSEYLMIPEERIITDESLFQPTLNHIIKTQKDFIEKNTIVLSPKICLIMDDCQSAEKFLKSSDFVKCFIAGRHYNISIICCGQSWTRFQRITRLNASNIMLYPSSGSEINLLCEEYCPANTSKKKFLELIQFATKEPYNFLHINNQTSHKDKYRKNLDLILNIN